MDTGLLADALIERAGYALEELLDSKLGKRHELLAPEPEEAVLALLGHPPDGRLEWEDLARDLRGQMLYNEGSTASPRVN
jgi:hypothetical protein